MAVTLAAHLHLHRLLNVSSFTASAHREKCKVKESSPLPNLLTLRQQFVDGPVRINGLHLKTSVNTAEEHTQTSPEGCKHSLWELTEVPGILLILVIDHMPVGLVRFDTLQAQKMRKGWGVISREQRAKLIHTHVPDKDRLRFLKYFGKVWKQKNIFRIRNILGRTAFKLHFGQDLKPWRGFNRWVLIYIFVFLLQWSWHISSIWEKHSRQKKCH